MPEAELPGLPDMMGFEAVAHMPRDVAAQGEVGVRGVAPGDHVHRGVSGLQADGVFARGEIELLVSNGIAVTVEQDVSELTIGIDPTATVTLAGLTMGDATLNADEWAFLDGQDQALKIADSPTFVDLTLTGNLDLVRTTATTGQITRAGARLLHTYGDFNLFAGVVSGNLTLTGERHVGLGRGALDGLTSGIKDVAVGYHSLSGATTGSYITAVGYIAGFVSDADGGVFLGHGAGRYEAAANKLFIDNALRDDEADGRVKALIYGVFDALTANQQVTINGALNVREGFTMLTGNITMAEDGWIGITGPAERLVFDGTGGLITFTACHARLDGTNQVQCGDAATYMAQDADSILALHADGYVRTGAGTTGHALGADGDFLVSGVLEVDGTAWFDGIFNLDSYSAGGILRSVFYMTEAGNAGISWFASWTHDQFLCIASHRVDRQVIFVGTGAYPHLNYDHADAGYFTLYIHDDTDPDSDNTHWMSLAQDGTNGIIGLGLGSLYIGATANQNIHAAQFHMGTSATEYISSDGANILDLHAASMIHANQGIAFVNDANELSWPSGSEIHHAAGLRLNGSSAVRFAVADTEYALLTASEFSPISPDVMDLGSVGQEWDTAYIDHMVGPVTIGDGGITNYTQFEADGSELWVGTATMWDDANLGAIILERGASAPDIISLSASTIRVPAFNGGATAEQLSGTLELPHSWKEASSITPHVHWMPTTANAGNVKWQLEYEIIGPGDTAGAGTTITVTTAAGGVAWDEIRSDFAAVAMAGKAVGTHIAFRIFRNPVDGADTYGDDAAMLTVGIHFEMDRPGSRQIITK